MMTTEEYLEARIEAVHDRIDRILDRLERIEMTMVASQHQVVVEDLCGCGAPNCVVAQLTTPLEELTQADVDVAVQAILTEEGVTLERLRQQARAGRFETESQRRAWFVIDGLVEPTDPMVGY